MDKANRLKTGSLAAKAAVFWEKYNYIVIFAVIFAAYIVINGDATTWTGVTNIFLHSAILGTIALGMGLVILTGDIDLSVGSMFVFIGGFSILLYNSTGSVFLMLLASLVMGAACGVINGLLVGRLRMPSFIVTLANMLIYRSISQYVMNELGETRYRVDATKSSYNAMFNFGNGSILTISNLAWIFFILAAVLIFYTGNIKQGKQIYAIGSNEKAARLAGINVYWKRVGVFIICGVMVGIASFLKIAKDTSFDPATSGKNFELYAIASVVIGGISMSGGSGSMLGILFGAMSFTLIDKIITALGMNALLNDTVKGVILLIAVAFQLLKKKEE